MRPAIAEWLLSGDVFWTAGEKPEDPANHRPISDVRWRILILSLSVHVST